MPVQQDDHCSHCSGGCSVGKTAAKQDEKIVSGLYLALGGIIIVLASIITAWFFRS